MTPTTTRRAKKPAAEPFVIYRWMVKDCGEDGPAFVGFDGEQSLWPKRRDAVATLDRLKNHRGFDNCRVVRVEVREITPKRKGAGR